MLIVDSVCLKVIDASNLLVGVGNQLHYYHTPNGNHESTPAICVMKDVLDERIHGICVASLDSGRHLIVCHGGRQFVQLVLDRQRLTRCRTTIQRTLINDLISCAHIYEFGFEMALLTAHGVAVRLGLDWHLNQGGQAIIETRKCPDKSTLYCSAIVEERKGYGGWFNSMFFGGTAFGELIVWRCVDQVPNILLRLECHNGVILSIDCCLQSNLVTTTSDDRSMKVWRFENTNNATKNITDFTGLRPVQTMFGHTGRVFSGKIIVVDSAAFVLTAGEDQNLCVWNVATGKLLHRQLFSSALWHIDYDPNQQIVYASGADGNCKRLPIAGILDGSNNHTEIVLPAIPAEADTDAALTNHLLYHSPREVLTKLIASDTPFKMPLIADLLSDPKKREMVLAAVPQYRSQVERATKVSFLDNGHVVVVTNMNRVACAHPDIAWTDPQPLAYPISLLETHKDWVAVAGAGVLSVYRFDDHSCSLKIYFSMKLMDESIRSLHFLSDDKYLIVDPAGNALMVNRSAIVVSRFSLPHSKEPWATAALLVGQLLVLGDRNGHLHLFEENLKGVFEQRHTLRHIHGRIGCTSLEVDGTPPADNTLRLITAGHDGTLKRISVDLSTKQMRIRHTLQTPIAWITRVVRDSDLVAGFNAKVFCVWNWRRREIVTEVECGGGHRSADVFCPANCDEGDFAFMRNKSLKWIRFKRDRLSLFGGDELLNNWHSMSCTTVAIVPSALTTLVISGGDDNLLKIHRLEANDSLHHLEDIVSHVSSVKALIVETIVSDRSWRIFSAGGRAQLCVSEVELLDGESVRVSEVADFMLHQSDAERKRSGTANVINSAAETRFMSIALSGGTDLFGACSDGYVRQLSWTSGGGIQLRGEVFYGRCVLKVSLVPGFVVTAATDGNICFWKRDDGSVLSDRSKPIAVIRHHESGIQSWDWCPLSPTSYQVVTGGDDQRVVLSTIQLIPEPHAMQTQCLENVHTAQVNGVTFAKDAIYTTGTDQTVFRWSREGEQPRQVARSCVADIKGICLVNDDGGCKTTSASSDAGRAVLVYGHGVQTMPVD